MADPIAATITQLRNIQARTVHTGNALVAARLEHHAHQ